MPDYDRVIIAGGGPVGLTAAVRLALAGVPVTVLETDPSNQTDWRASTFHGSTLELLEPTGLLPQMLAEGLKAPTYQLRDKQGGLVAEFDFAVLADELKYPYRLQLNQQHLVRMLLERLRALPLATVRFDTRLVGSSQEAGGIHVRSQRGEHFYGAFLFGADGAASTVRRLLGVSFDGMTYAERFSIVSFVEDPGESIPGLTYVNYVADPVEWFFLLRTPESWRMLTAIPVHVTDDEALSDSHVQARLQRAAPRSTPYTLLDRQIYRVHQRVAGAFRVGRVLLMGDAAHVNSPLGGVGLNSGIHDATDAAIRVSRLMTGGAQPSNPGWEGAVEAELTTYDAIRRKVAVEYVQKDTHQNTLRMGETDAERRQREQTELAAVAADPERARAYLRRVSLLEPIQRYGIGTRPQVSEAQEPPPAPSRGNVREGYNP